MSKSLRYARRLINANRVMVFSKSYCPFCHGVKEIFNTLDVPYHVAELNEIDEGAELQNDLYEMFETHTVPQVFIDGDHIGGYTDTQKLYDNGELQELIAKVKGTV